MYAPGIGDVSKKKKRSRHQKKMRGVKIHGAIESKRCSRKTHLYDLYIDVGTA